MAWWNNTNLKLNDTMAQIIRDLVLYCPSSIVKSEKDSFYLNGKKKYRNTYYPVSARFCSFRERGIKDKLLLTLLAQVKRVTKQKGVFEVIESSESVSEKIDLIQKESPWKDPNYEIVVFKRQSAISDVESFFYYIRCALAHGSFEIIDSNDPVYVLESKKESNIKARMRIKQSTLQEYIKLSKVSPSELRGLQHKKK